MAVRILRRSMVAAVLVAGIGCAFAASAPATDAPAASWVELGPGRTVLVRAITEASACPKVAVDGTSEPMDERAGQAPPEYPVLTCELELPRDAKRVTLAGRRLPLPGGRPQRIAVVGDAGCRLGGPGFSQACNDPAQWPFAEVAKSVANYKPDLVIHVGDYLYREQPCPAGNTGCAGSPSGENWPTWDADLFTPAAAALKAAPWLFVRGNHEACSRGGPGWFRFLDPRPMPAACQDFTDPYSVRVGGPRLLVLDSARASDFPPFNPDAYAPQFAALAAMASAPKAWLLTHKPVWGLAPTSMGQTFAITNTTLEQASSNSLPSPVRLVLSGHLHQAQVFNFSGDRPPQIVGGNSGTLLDSKILAPIAGTDVANETITDAETLAQFGFTTFSRRHRRWGLRLRDVDGNVVVRCRLSGHSVTCPPQ